MEIENSQEDKIEVSESEINFIFCKPYDENFYLYSVNSIDSEHLITRQSLNDFLFKISNSYYRTNYLTSHFRNFIYNKQENSFIELQEDDMQESIQTFVRKDLENIMISNPTSPNRFQTLLQKLKKTLS